MVMFDLKQRRYQPDATHSKVCISCQAVKQWKYVSIQVLSYTNILHFYEFDCLKRAYSLVVDLSGACGILALVGNLGRWRIHIPLPPHRRNAPLILFSEL